jgi:hypothetical protein
MHDGTSGLLLVFKSLIEVLDISSDLMVKQRLHKAGGQQLALIFEEEHVTINELVTTIILEEKQLEESIPKFGQCQNTWLDKSVPDRGVSALTDALIASLAVPDSEKKWLKDFYGDRRRNEGHADALSQFAC